MSKLGKEKRIGEGEDESDDYYDREDDEKMLEDDELTPAEAGFMEGYENQELVKCCNCKKLCDLENAFEKEIKGKTYLFCSEECAEEFEEDRKEGKE